MVSERTLPSNWHVRPDAPTSGPVVVLDMDGVISNATHRQHFLRGGRRDYRGFFTAAVDDPPYDLVLAASVDDSHTVAILTARPYYMADATRSWLAANEVRHDLLILRPADGRQPRPLPRLQTPRALPPAGRRATRSPSRWTTTSASSRCTARGNHRQAQPACARVAGAVEDLVGAAAALIAPRESRPAVRRPSPRRRPARHALDSKAGTKGVAPRTPCRERR